MSSQEEDYWRRIDYFTYWLVFPIVAYEVLIILYEAGLVIAKELVRVTIGLCWLPDKKELKQEKLAALNFVEDWLRRNRNLTF